MSRTNSNNRTRFANALLLVAVAALMLVTVYMFGCSRSSRTRVVDTPPDNNVSSLALEVAMNPEVPNTEVKMQGIEATPIQLFSALEEDEAFIATPMGGTKPELLSQPGSGFLIAMPANRVETTGDSAVFSPQNVDINNFEGDQIAYSTYRFRIPSIKADPTKPQTLTFDWKIAPRENQTALVGLSNVYDNQWDWFNVPEDNTLTLESYDNYLTGSSELMAIVVVNGVDTCELNEIRIGEPETRGIGLVATSIMPGTIEEYRPTSRTLSAVPASYDLSANCAPIRDQGNWGSCAAFATGDGALNYSLKVAYGSGWNLADNKFKVSPAWIYVKSGPDQGLNCTQGRILPYLLESLKQVSTRTAIGSATELNAPYNTSTCTPSWPQAATDDASVLKIDSYQSVDCSTDAGINTMKSILAEQLKPLVFGTEVDNNFMNYSTLKATNPVWNFTGSSLGGHAMLVVGYDDSKSAFKVRNSWSTGWGFSGYCWIGYTTFKNKVKLANGFGPYVMTNSYKSAVATRFGLSGGGGGGTTTLAAPTNVVATDGTYTNKVKITWTAATGAKSYSIYRDSAVSPTKSGITTTYYEDTLTDGNSHSYKLVSVDGTKTSSFSLSDTGYTTQLVAPAGLTASDASSLNPGKIAIKITPPVGGQAPSIYKLYRSTSSSGSYSLIGSPMYSASTVTYLDATITAGTTYYYKAVSAKPNWPDSKYSVTDSGSAYAPLTLNVPSKIVATDGTQVGRVDVQVYAPTGGIIPTGYRVYRAATATGSYTKIGEILYAAGYVTYKDATAVGGTTYYYKAVSYKTGSADSGYSSYDSGYAKPTVNKPSKVTASDGTIVGYVDVRIYPPVGGVIPTGYKLYRSTALTGTYTLINQPIYSATYAAYKDTTALPGTTYYYKALSFKSGYPDSPYCTEDAGSSKATLNAPYNIVASNNTIVGKVEIKIYPPTTGAIPASYKLYRSTSSTGTFSQIATPAYASGFTTYNDTTAVAGTTYYYKAVCVKSGWPDSAYSKVVTGVSKLPLNAPSNIVASDNTVVGKVEVRIYAPTSGAMPTGYKLYRSTSSTGTFSLISQPAYATSYSTYFDTTAVANTVYYYKAVCYKTGYTDSGYSKVETGSRK